MSIMPLNNLRILVTGGAGFIGSRAVGQINAAGGIAGILDNLSVGLPMPPSSPSIVTCKSDIRDEPAVSAFVKDFKPDVVLHLAAIHHIPTCEHQRSYALDVNVVGTEIVLAACEANNIEKIVMASTGAVYAWSDEHLREEESPLAAADNYSISKLANEKQCQLWAERNRRQVNVARIFNTIGANDPNAHLIPDIMDQIPIGGGEVTLRLGNLKPRRDYIFVDDTATGLLRLCQFTSKSVVEVVNICTGTEVPVENLVYMIGDVLGAHLTIEQDPDRMRRVDRMSQVGDVSKAKKLLNWQVKLPLRDAIVRIVNDIRASKAN